MNKNTFNAKFCNMYDQIHTAYHESGHAIFAISHLVPVFSVEINLPKDKTYYNSGLCKYLDIPTGNVFDEISAGILYSGRNAEKVLYKKISNKLIDEIFLHKSYVDLSYVKELKLSDSKKNNIDKYSYKFLSYFYDDITFLSHKLIEKKNLNFRQISQYLIKKNKQYWFSKIDYIYNNNLLLASDLVNDNYRKKLKNNLLENKKIIKVSNGK